ncbi:MAG: transposase [Pseudonocardia sp.]
MRRGALPTRPRHLPARDRRTVPLPGQAQPARRLHRTRRAALGPDPDWSPQRRARPRTDRDPHHPGPAHAGGPAVPAPQPGLADRALHPRHHRGAHRRGRATQPDQPHPTQADPTQIAELVQHHWDIESLHRLRDTVYHEDHSRARTGNRPHIMAALRNPAIGAIHLIAAATSPKRPAGPPATCTAPSTFFTSTTHDLGMTV